MIHPHGPPSMPHMPESGLGFEGARFTPTAEGFGASIDAALAKHTEAVEYVEPDDAADIGGGEQLMLYPDPRDQGTFIKIETISPDAESGRFAERQERLLTYQGGRGSGRGVYQVYGSLGRRNVYKTTPSRRANHSQVGIVNFDSSIEEGDYAAVIAAMEGASTERPIERRGRARRVLGHIAARW